ncbi:MAG TPA: hypothetical protein PLP27_01055 [Crocinitomicaceae bacterium]|nr:hypothetical protein [Crocinitomicaceae bacterium]
MAYRSVRNSIEISKSATEIYNYLGNSNNASHWSVYVDHITTLNADKIPEGTVGSTRRCFKNQNEQGIVWDEDITETIPNVKRQLSIYNAKEFPIMADGLLTEQLYEPINDSITILTFTLFHKDANPTIWTVIKFHVAAYVVSSVFNRNLKNIKQYVENGNLQ